MKSLNYKDFLDKLLIFPNNTIAQHFLNPYLGFLRTNDNQIIPIRVSAWGEISVLASDWSECGIDEEDFDRLIKKDEDELGIIYRLTQKVNHDDPDYEVAALTKPDAFPYTHGAVLVTNILWKPELLVSREEKLIDMFNAFFQNASIPLIMLSHSDFLEYTEMNDEDDEEPGSHTLGVICDLRELPEEDQVLGGTYHVYYGAPENPGEYLMSWDSFPTPDIIGMGPILGRLFEFSPLSK